MSGAPPLLHRGKVRELYDAGDGLLLMVASDRISAFDVVMAEPIPDKGRVLTAMTVFWCEELADLAPGSLVTADPSAIARRAPGAEALGDLAGRAMLVRRAEMLPLECIVRGYLAGQAYSEYAASGTIHGAAMPAGLRLADRLPEPIFTPSTKATEGHDENIDFAAAQDLVGHESAAAARDLCLALYARAAARVEAAGFVLADTKFELGLVDGRLTLCDEVVTPDSSRLWPLGEVVPGTTPPAFDKQPLRDWVDAQPWDKRPPPPALPPEVVAATSARYVAAYERVTGRLLRDWYGARQ
ncbi:MAG TPA: phosphoribosylaminoimidazolesuccinocarboxamide synthase [Acidimicrobiales bacterium]|nr:phosphoribosylaminoimidazolesuccinocarboxamide synthase [Acidimicrobiales bacterium]